MIATIKLVALNCLRTSPAYLGSFMICEAVHIFLEGKEYSRYKGLMSIPLLNIIYFFIKHTSGVEYYFGTPALMVTLVFTVLIGREWFPSSIFSQISVIAIAIFTTQSLTVHPRLNSWGFGQGEIAYDIKLISDIMGYDHALGFFSLFLFCTFAFIAMMMGLLVKDEYKIKQAYKEREHILRQLSDSKIKNLELRTYEEIQNIVHDLKTPLATIQGLSSLCEMLEENEQKLEYYKRISKSVDSMSGMISEILYEDRKAAITTDELIRNLSSLISPNEEMSRIISYQNDCSGSMIEANRIRFIRAIINIMENSYAACQRSGKSNTKIAVSLSKINDEVCIEITDNGDGIPADKLDSIWSAGYSTNNSSGIGLAFTKKIIENHGGRIEIQSQHNENTTVIIWIKEICGEAYLNE